MKIISYLHYAIIFILPLTVTALIFANNILEVQSGWKKEFYLNHLNNYYKIFNTEEISYTKNIIKGNSKN